MACALVKLSWFRSQGEKNGTTYNWAVKTENTKYTENYTIMRLYRLFSGEEKLCWRVFTLSTLKKT